MFVSSFFLLFYRFHLFAVVGMRILELLKCVLPVVVLDALHLQLLCTME